MSHAAHTAEILTQLEAGPVDSGTLARVLLRSHSSVYDELERLLSNGKVGFQMLKNSVSGVRLLPNRPMAAVKGDEQDQTPAPSIAGLRYVPAVAPMTGYDRALERFHDVCMLARR